MRWSFVQRETWSYRKLVQQRFWKASGIVDHEFAILDPGRPPWSSVPCTDGIARPIPESAYCVLRQAEVFTIVLIPRSDFPAVAEAILLIRAAQLSGPRVTRYMLVYQAYESVVDNRDPAFSAVRHALSHAPSALTRKSTVDELNRIFGSPHINLGTYAHLKQFNVHMGRLVVATDKALGGILAGQPGLIRSEPMRADDLDAA